MNRQKDIFDLFRENQHKLDERPPLHTWRHLEKRLNHHRRRNRLSLYRSLAMVAAVLALVVFMVLLSTVIHQSKMSSVAGNAPVELEDLPDAPQEEVAAYQVVEFSRSYQDRMSKPIEEGRPNQRLVPTVN